MNYNVKISNAFSALGSLPEDSDEALGKIRDTILSTASVIVPPRRSKKRKWLSPSTLDIVDLKRKARLWQPSRIQETQRGL